jgi:glycerol-3-phosphate acyltransferase PlsY
MKHVGRKLYHLLGGLGLLSLYYLLGRIEALWTYTILAGSVLVLEIIRLRVPAFNDLVFRHFGSFIRKTERNAMTGTIPYVLGIGISLLLFSTEIATAAVCFLACGDVAAATIGERYGRTKIAGEKSLEGTVAFFAASVGAGALLSLIGHHLPIGLVVAGASVAAAVELLPIPVNDNLTIPLSSGGAMTLIAKGIGLS